MSQQNAELINGWYIADCDVTKQPTFEECTNHKNGYLIVNINGQLKAANPIYEQYNGTANLMSWSPFGEPSYVMADTVVAYQPIQIPQTILDTVFANPKSKRSILYQNHH